MPVTGIGLRPYQTPAQPGWRLDASAALVLSVVTSANVTAVVPVPEGAQYKIEGNVQAFVGSAQPPGCLVAYYPHQLLCDITCTQQSSPGGCMIVARRAP